MKSWLWRKIMASRVTLSLSMLFTTSRTKTWPTGNQESFQPRASTRSSTTRLGWTRANWAPSSTRSNGTGRKGNLQLCFKVIPTKMRSEKQWGKQFLKSQQGSRRRDMYQPQAIIPCLLSRYRTPQLINSIRCKWLWTASIKHLWSQLPNMISSEVLN